MAVAQQQKRLNTVVIKSVQYKLKDVNHDGLVIRLHGII